MEISDIKAHLTISAVLSRYGLQVKNKMICCPFHADKTPSMQVFEDSNTVRCYSGNCERSGKVIDVIDFILYKENCTKHQAIEIAKSLVMGITVSLPVINEVSVTKASHKFYREIDGENLDELFTALVYNLRLGKRAQTYLQERALDKSKLEIGYNSRTWKGLCNCIIFPLRNITDHVTSLYGRSILEKGGKHFYLKNRQGLYPGYPSVETTKLILFESVIDCSSMLQYKDLLEDDYALLPAMGQMASVKNIM